MAELLQGQGSGNAWQQADVAHAFLDKRRAMIPYAADQLAMAVYMVRQLHPQPKLVADLGCGDGLVGRTILDQFPGCSGIFVDHSAPMLERCREACASYDADRTAIHAADLRDPLDAQLLRGVDVIVSGYAIHHLPHERKRALYREIHDALIPGGVFINIEHVASVSAVIESAWDNAYIDRMTSLSGRDRDNVSREFHERTDKSDNILAPVYEQVSWLRGIGFVNADCYFQFLELAVFGGQKSRS